MVPPEGIAALLAASMMAISPVTGTCEGRVIQLCTGNGAARHMLIWDEDAPPLPPSTAKACHACTLDKKKPDRRPSRKS